MTRWEAINYLKYKLDNSLDECDVWLDPNEKAALDIIAADLYNLENTVNKLSITIREMNKRIEADQLNGKDTLTLELERDFANQIVESLSRKETD